MHSEWHKVDTLYRSGTSSSALAGLNCIVLEFSSGLAGFELLKQARIRDVIHIVVRRLAQVKYTLPHPLFALLICPAHRSQ